METSKNDSGSMRPCSRGASLRCSLGSNAFLWTDMARVCLAVHHLLSGSVSVLSRKLLPPGPHFVQRQLTDFHVAASLSTKDNLSFQ